MPKVPGNPISTLPDNTWNSATSTFNYMQRDPLLDWFGHHYNPVLFPGAPIVTGADGKIMVAKSRRSSPATSTAPSLRSTTTSLRSTTTSIRATTSLRDTSTSLQDTASPGIPLRTTTTIFRGSDSPIIHLSNFKDISLCSTDFDPPELDVDPPSYISHILNQGNIFEAEIIADLRNKFGEKRVLSIGGERNSHDPKFAKSTFDAMKRGVPIIHGGVLHNASNKTFGIPDLLVRSDWLNILITKRVITDKDKKRGCVFNKRWHYRVVDIKYTCLNLRANGVHMLNSGAIPAYKSQLWIYTAALAHLQKYNPYAAYILGRRYKYEKEGNVYSSVSAYGTLGTIDYKTVDHLIPQQTDDALLWLNDVKSAEASNWNLTVPPLSREELYPNMCNSYDEPWHGLKEYLSSCNYDLTALWMVGPKNRKLALQKGIYQWNDSRCTPESLGINGEKTGRLLKAIIDINRDSMAIISPQYIEYNTNGWKRKPVIEFFVDFETTNGAMSSITDVESADISTTIFMIGVGYIDPHTEGFIYKSFITTQLIPAEELRICIEFVDYLKEIATPFRIWEPRCIHWSSAEEVMWEGALSRHPSLRKRSVMQWLDIMDVFKGEPVVINGCMSFGLKSVGKSLYRHGLINVTWDEENTCGNGRDALVAAYRASAQARTLKCKMTDLPMMADIEKYNEVDVRILHCIIEYLRSNHIKPKTGKKSKGTQNVKKRKRVDIQVETPAKKIRTK